MKMGLIQDWIRKLRERKEDKENYERGMEIQEGFENRKMNANERELLRFRERDRQKRIKEELDGYRKEENDRFWSGKFHNPVDADNVVKDQKELFNGKDDLFTKKTSFFNQPDLFFGG